MLALSQAQTVLVSELVDSLVQFLQFFTQDLVGFFFVHSMTAADFAIHAGLAKTLFALGAVADVAVMTGLIVTFQLLQHIDCSFADSVGSSICGQGRHGNQAHQHDQS